MRFLRATYLIIGVKGNNDDCVKLKAEVKNFIATNLKMELSEEKTLITHSSINARFLGYDIKVRRNNKIKQGGQGYSKRTLNYMIELNIPLKDKIERFLFENKVVTIKNGTLFPVKRNRLINLTELEIVSIFNAELRGICNYYNLASNFCSLNYFEYIMEYSCLKTLAAKHKSTISNIKNKYKDKKGNWCIPYTTKTGLKLLYFAKHIDCKEKVIRNDIRDNTVMIHSGAITTFEDRLKAKMCELCGSTDSKNYEIHHINKIKNLKGKKLWEKIMIAKKRKTIVVCKNCHNKIHNN